ncbi:hypothetical protein I7I53_06404 [Histoplasma capsulatum var. duboisii H88]|nr:hypothetical protein I7I53_06404 [Histoplasma capsulatum var. duboisii H88]
MTVTMGCLLTKPLPAASGKNKERKKERERREKKRKENPVELHATRHTPHTNTFNAEERCGRSQVVSSSPWFVPDDDDHLLRSCAVPTLGRARFPSAGSSVQIVGWARRKGNCSHWQKARIELGEVGLVGGRHWMITQKGSTWLYCVQHWLADVLFAAGASLLLRWNVLRAAGATANQVGDQEGFFTSSGPKRSASEFKSSKCAQSIFYWWGCVS